MTLQPHPNHTDKPRIRGSLAGHDRVRSGTSETQRRQTEDSSLVPADTGSLQEKPRHAWANQTVDPSSTDTKPVPPTAKSP